MLNRVDLAVGGADRATIRQEISDEAWVVMAPFLPTRKPVGRPILDMHTVLEAIAWRFRTGSPWRDVLERFGNGKSIYSYLCDWCKDGTWQQLLAAVQSDAARCGDLLRTVLIDLSITRVHQHGASLLRGPSRDIGGLVERQEAA